LLNEEGAATLAGGHTTSRRSDVLDPISVPTLKDAFVRQLEELILSNKLSIGEMLPSERELAVQMGVSRPVVHDGLMELAAKGLVTIKPRVGTVVNDYRKEGSLAMLSTLINHQRHQADSALLQSMLSFRRLVESETARLAALNRTQADLDELHGLLEVERQVGHDKTAAVVDADFALHHQVALASGNIIYPMMLKSFEPAYTSLTKMFFSRREVVAVVFAFHRELVGAIEDQDLERSADVMLKLLAHGVEVLTAELSESAGEGGDR
jgi:GntR family transcriptional regulator, transcriptional repressor for pyruvate dehydrogenase complex